MRKSCYGVVVALAAVSFFVISSPLAAQEAAVPSAADSEAAESPAAESPAWIQAVDAFFAKYLVKPVAAVAFYPIPYYDFSAGAWRPSVDPATADLPENQQKLIGTQLPVVVVWLVAGATFFTFRMGFINIRGFWHAIRVVKGDYDDPEDEGEVSHFQALASALSATVGLGNIGGVAIAVGTGGPGALFWMLIAGVLGMSSKFVECTLAQSYRHVDPDGQVSGGPMRYLADGLREMGLGVLGTFLAVLFSVFCVMASFGGGCAFQVDQSLGAIKTQLTWLDDGHEYVYGLVMAAAVGVVIIGGIRRIAATAEKIVPLMCGLYILIALYILFANYDRIPWAFEEIIRTAFNADAAKGGVLGVLVIGFKRAAFSNEAGSGSAAIAHAAAKAEEPIREGAAAPLGPVIDTVIVCMMTGLVIVITQVYDPAKYPDLQEYVIGDKGAALTSKALELQVSWFPYLLSVAVVLFAYSTMISWSYYGERCATTLFGRRASLPYKMLFLVFVFLGSIVSAKNVLDFSDLMILTMAFPNVLGVALLSGKVRRDLDDYWRRYKAGEFKVHK